MTLNVNSTRHFLHAVLTEGQSDPNHTAAAAANNLLFVHITVFMFLDNFQLVLLIIVSVLFFFLVHTI